MTPTWPELCTCCFQKSVEQLVGDIPDMACYLDDIVMTGRLEQEHLSNLQKIMDKLNVSGLFLKLEKYQFFKIVSLI